eukprot:TRINITY_DN5472_c0_g1_i9.p2 TRINITY_DN5472_c0_g1~~TRINITY_DN5472_c0_g1_i9.p2  ORF type:complete len:277 (-),score=31.04 TRINITY_DN5472_c0_g1_i9:1041-1871(-)
MHVFLVFEVDFICCGGFPIPPEPPSPPSPSPSPSFFIPSFPSPSNPIFPSFPSSPCPTCHCKGGPTFSILYEVEKARLLDLDDDALYIAGLEGFYNCKIVESPVGNGNACDLYVKIGSIGYPLNRYCGGTGCVKAPDFPRAIANCSYASAAYCPRIQALASDICTDSGVANAAAQLRHAITNDHCNCNNTFNQSPAFGFSPLTTSFFEQSDEFNPFGAITDFALPEGFSTTPFGTAFGLSQNNPIVNPPSFQFPSSFSSTPFGVFNFSNLVFDPEP